MDVSRIQMVPGPQLNLWARAVRRCAVAASSVLGLPARVFFEGCDCSTRNVINEATKGSCAWIVHLGTTSASLV